MEWTAIPIMLDEIVPLSFIPAQQWCDKNILAAHPTFDNDLMPALCCVLDVEERELQIHV